MKNIKWWSYFKWLFAWLALVVLPLESNILHDLDLFSNIRVPESFEQYMQNRNNLGDLQNSYPNGLLIFRFGFWLAIFNWIYVTSITRDRSLSIYFFFSRQKRQKYSPSVNSSTSYKREFGWGIETFIGALFLLSLSQNSFPDRGWGFTKAAADRIVHWTLLETLKDTGVLLIMLISVLGYFTLYKLVMELHAISKSLEFNNDRSAFQFNRVWGFVNRDGDVLIPPKYDYIYADSKDATVTINGKDGVLDKTGKEVIPCLYDYINCVDYERISKVKLMGKYGFINRDNGTLVTPLKYDFAGDFTIFGSMLFGHEELPKGLTWVNIGGSTHSLTNYEINGGKYGYVDIEGNEYWDMTADEAHEQMMDRDALDD